MGDIIEGNDEIDEKRKVTIVTNTMHLGITTYSYIPEKRTLFKFVEAFKYEKGQKESLSL